MPTPQIQDIQTLLADAILDHRLAPGQHLNEAQLAKAFDVSRSAIRPALTALESLGLVQIEQNRGAFVAKPTLEDAVHLFQALAALEKAAADLILVAESLSKSAALDALREIDLQQRDAQRSGQLTESVKLSIEFHIQFVSLSGNRFLIDAHYKLLLQYRLVTAVFRTSMDYCLLEDHHGKMVDLLREGSGPKLKRLLEAHWKHLVLGHATLPDVPPDLVAAVKGQ